MAILESRLPARLGLPITDRDWVHAVRSRRFQIARFMSWAALREPVDSMRLSKRADILRVGRVLDAFSEPWWAAVTYSCFDSVAGTLAVANLFRRPTDPQEAQRLLAQIVLPVGSVQHHRTQPGHKGARNALISACAHANDLQRILRDGSAFHDRYEAIRGLRAKQWGRTTSYDLLVRTGHLAISSATIYVPDRAYLGESTGPRKGFHLIWGVEVTRWNIDQCEATLRGWTARWHDIARQVGVEWNDEPYGPGDFENALCIFQEPGNAGYTKAS